MWNAGLKAWFVEENRKGDRQYVLRPDEQRSIAWGARLVALRGARRCWGRGCATPLAGSDRRDYCGPCESSGRAALDRERDLEAVRVVLDRAVPAILRVPSRVRQRRLTRQEA